MENIIIKVLSTIVIIIICSIAFMKLRKYYKEAESNLEKTIYDIIAIAIIFIGIIYFLDSKNLPSKFGYTKNINSSDWVNNITNYAIVIFSTLLNSAFLIFVTGKQIDASYKDNLKINKKMHEENTKLNNEMQRIQNLPLLRYRITNDKLDGQILGDNKKWLFSNHDINNSDSIDLTIEFENIGLNAIRKIYLEVESEILNGREHFELCNQSNLEKNEIKKKELIITNVSKGTYKMKIFVYYQDLLKNWYKQEIDLIIVNSDTYSPENGGFDYVDSYVVHEEVRLKSEPKFK